MTVDTPRLFSPLQVGNVLLQHRISLTPLTRLRATIDNQPSDDLHVTYYSQRAQRPGTLLLTEGVFISPDAIGWPHAPGIWNKSQIDTWRKVFEAVHKQKSYIFVQLWALGHAANPSELKRAGVKYRSVSGINPAPNAEDAPTPAALTKEEIHMFIQDYVQAAKNAIEAGADGVELHSANGYLPDQFLHDNTNKRTDEYGGSIENKARFILEILDALIDSIGAERVSVRFSPWTWFNDVYMDGSPVPTYAYLVDQLEQRAKNGKRLAFIDIIEPRANGVDEIDLQTRGDNTFFRTIWNGVIISCGGFGREEALARTEKDSKLIIGQGRNFISNPDLVDKFEMNLPLTPYDRSTFYTNGPEGYIDYGVGNK